MFTVDADLMKWILDALLFALGTILWADYKETKATVRKNKETSNSNVDRFTVAMSDLRLKSQQDLAATTAASVKELSDYKLHVAEHYPTHEYLSKVMETILVSIRDMSNKIDKWDSKLEGKVDKE
jgi:hypothetical protein